MKRFLRTAALWALLTISAALPAGADAAEQPSLCLRQQLDCQADGTYTLTLQAWAAVRRYTGWTRPTADGDRSNWTCPACS